MGAVAWFFMPDTPDRARFLAEEEKVIAKARGVRQVGEEEAHRVGHIRGPDILAALLDLKARDLIQSHFPVTLAHGVHTDIEYNRTGSQL